MAEKILAILEKRWKQPTDIKLLKMFFDPRLCKLHQNNIQKGKYWERALSLAEAELNLFVDDELYRPTGQQPETTSDDSKPAYLGKPILRKTVSHIVLEIPALYKRTITSDLDH